MVNKRMKIMFLFLTLMVLLISAVNATEASDDTSIDEVSDEKTAPAEKKVIKKYDEVSTLKQQENTIHKNDGEDKTRKERIKTYDVNDYETLQSLFTTNNDSSIDINLNKDINLESTTILNGNISFLNINGNGNTINGQEKYSFLNIGANSTVSVHNLVIKNCSSDGQEVILNKGNLTLDNVSFDKNNAEMVSVIYNTGNIVFNNSQMVNHEAFGFKAMSNFGNVFCYNSKFNSNKAHESFIENHGNLTMDKCIINKTIATEIIYNTGHLTINNSIIGNSSNVINNYGEAGYNLILINNTLFENNMGEIGSFDGIIRIDNSNFTNNLTKNYQSINYYENLQGYLLMGIDTSQFDEPVSYSNTMTITNCNFKNKSNNTIYSSAVYTILNTTVNGELRNIKVNTDILWSTNLTLNITPTINQNKNMTIKGKLTFIDGTMATDKTLTIKINNQTKKIKTETDGYFNYTFKASKVGKNTITVAYTSTSRHGNSSITKNFKVLGESKITINKIKTTQFEDKTLITGKLVNQDKKGLNNITLKLKINNRTTTIKTDKNGSFSYTHKTYKSKTNTVQITFSGNNDYIKSTTNTTFYVTNRTTQLTIPTYKPKTYKQEVLITGKLKDKTGKTIKNAIIKVKVNSKTYTIKTNNKGIYTVKHKTYKIGTNTVTVTYSGNTYYKTITKKTTFKTTPRPTKITVNKISTTKKSKKVKITGKLTDNKGSILKNTKIKIKINTKTITVKTNNKGIYTYNYKTSKKGTNTITVTFPKSTNYKTSSAKTTFKVK